MWSGFEVIAAKPKSEGKQPDPPTQASMRASSPDKIRRNPSTDQRKVRRQMSKRASGPSLHNDYWDGGDSAANASFWSGRADAERAKEKARQERMAYKGQEVVVVKGRKVPIGTRGICFYSGEGQYGWRIGFTTSDGQTIWTDYNNVDLASNTVSASRRTAFGEVGEFLPGGPHPVHELQNEVADDSEMQDDWSDDFAHDAALRTSAFDISDPTDLRPLHTRVAVALLKKG